MKLTAKCDVEAPASFVYLCLTDFPTWEGEAIHRGAEVERPADRPLAGPGAAWRIRFPFRGRVRTLLIRLEALIADSSATYALDGPSIEGHSVMEVFPLSPRRTRIKVAVEVRPKTLAARLFINTLRLAKGRVQARFDARAAQLGTMIEARYAKSRPQPARV